MRAQTIMVDDEIHTTMDGGYTEHFRHWARLYIAVSIIELSYVPHFQDVEALYSSATGRCPT